MESEWGFKHVKSKAIYRLPVAYNREIGRVIVRWAFFEQHIQYLVWAIAFKMDDSGAALGRSSIIETRFPDRLDLLKRLAEIRDIGFDGKLLKTMKTKSKRLSEKRNLLAHGSWTKDDEFGWLVQETRGIWDDIGYGPSGRKGTTPEAVPMKPQDIADIVKKLDDLIADAGKLKMSLHHKI